MRIPTLAAAILPVFLLLGCAHNHPPQPMADAPPSLNQILDLQWQLAQLDAKSVDQWLPAADAQRPDLSFLADSSGTHAPRTHARFAGFNGVNRYFGNLPTDDLAQGRWNASHIGTTRMAGPPELMDLERAFMAALDNSRRWGVSTDGTRLTLSKATGEATAIFNRQGQAPRTGFPVTAAAPVPPSPPAAPFASGRPPEPQPANFAANNRPRITMKGQPVTLEGRPHPRIGSAAPRFTAVANDLSEKSLSDFKGKVVILSTLPSLETPVCDAQARAFNQRTADLGDGFVTLIVSMDLPFTQKRWCGAAGIDRIVTLSDSKRRQVGDLYGLRIAEHGLLCRSVTIIDAAGIVRYQQIVPEVASEPDYDAAIAAAKAAAPN